MGFVKTYEELGRMARETFEFYDSEVLTVMWETKPEIIERLLPYPLKPAAKPLASAFIAYYPKTNFGPSYYEGALNLRANFDGVEGNYCLAMPVTGDLAMAGGREQFGYPKKIANIEFNHSGDKVEGWCERHGLRFFEVGARLNGKPNAEEFQDIIANWAGEEGVVFYNFKHFLGPDGSSFDYNPRLIRERVILRPHTVELGEAEVVLSPSDYDPWTEVEIVKMLGAVYTVGNNTMLKGDVVAEVEPMAFFPYSLLKWDWWPVS